jgi:hypothetical protein
VSLHLMGQARAASRNSRTYQLMEIGAQPSEPAVAGLDGRSFVPGFYVSTVDELPASGARDGRARVRGYYAVFWPMDDQHENDESSAMYFGPFPSERDADGFVRRVSGSGSMSA